MSKQTQELFALALLDLNKPVPDGTASWNGTQPLRRFGVYRNNISSSLTAALSSRFPALVSLVGYEFFNAMAHEFIRDNPPHSPVLLTYGEDFPLFVESFGPARDIPYLADVSRLELARGHAYHSIDAKPLNAGSLTSVKPEDVASLRFWKHPSLSIVQSRYPIVTIWEMNTGQEELRQLDNWEGEDAIVVRPEMAVNVHRLSPGEATFLTSLCRGNQLLQAVNDAKADAHEFALESSMARALSAGVFTEATERKPQR